MILRALVRLALVVAAVAAALLPLPAWAVEQWYSLGLYPRMQAVVTPLTNHVPVALLDVLVALIILVTVWRFTRAVRSGRFLRAVLSTFAGLLTLSAAAYLAFLFLWGLNYRRVPIEQKIDFDEARVTREAAQQLAHEAVARLNGLHSRAHSSTVEGTPLELAFARAEQRLGKQSITIVGLPKRSLLEFYFRWAAIDGMTNPLFLEIILNPDVLPVERPFVLAHEWGHLAGYASEDEANLIAWMTCLEGNPVAQYSGWLAIYSHVMSGLPRGDRGPIAAQLENGPRRDLNAISDRYARSKPFVRNVARETYDAYLRANRVDEGIASYDAVVRLILGAGPTHGWAPQLRSQQ